MLDCWWMNTGERGGEREQQEWGPWVGSSVDSVDSVANLGWGGRAGTIRQSFTQNSWKNQTSDRPGNPRP